MEKKKFSFTEAYNKFEKILEELDSSNISLEDQLKKIEEGGELYKVCIKYLNEAGAKIKTINKKIKDIDL
ncbi:exodeoxyribonuclease VII small subunit [Patescibacteria group bacterium]|nr:exodeoxyribonuclease VII small subunit [Patescibacteria group bacterium]